MDDNLITPFFSVASSLATLWLTNHYNSKNKRIDTEQKVNEHKLAIRSEYVKKKIDAGLELTDSITLDLRKKYCNVAILSIFY